MGVKELASALPRVVVGALLNQGKLWLGEDGLAALDAALSSPNDSFLESLRGWVQSEDAKRQLAAVAERAEGYVREHCKDSELQQVFSLGFASLSSVQNALAELPRRLDGEAVRRVLVAAIERDFPSLQKEQAEKASDCYARALDHALLSHKDLASFVTGLVVFQIRDQQGKEFARVNEKLDEVLSMLSQGRVPGEADWVILRQALTESLHQKTTLPGDLPPGSYLPLARNAIFTGREEELAELARFLLENGENAVVRQAIAGMGGVGKTQLAVEFAHRYGHRFAGVHWLDMNDPERLDEQIARNGLEMGLTPWPEKQPEQVAATLKAWRSSGPQLLILDNYESPKNASEILGRLSGAELRLLITTRNKEWHQGLNLKVLELKEFSPEVSLAFLRRWLPEERASDSELAGLAKRLGHLPLALELAGRYLDRVKNKAVEDYLSELENALEHRSMRGWKPELGNPTNHDLSLQQTFALSWQRVKSKAAQQVLMAAGYCAPNEPLPMEALKGVAGGADELSEALADLMGLGLFKEGDPPAIHPLIAEFAQGLDKKRKALLRYSEELINVNYNILNDNVDISKIDNLDISKFDSVDISNIGNVAISKIINVNTININIVILYLYHLRILNEIMKKELCKIYTEIYFYENNKAFTSAIWWWNNLSKHLRNLADYKNLREYEDKAILIKIDLEKLLAISEGILGNLDRNEAE